MEINRPEVVAEVAAAFAAYEAALVAGAPDRIVDFFWQSPEAVRYGIADQQIGVEEQRAWRWAQPPLPAGRRLWETRIATFGADHAVVNTLFGYPGGSAVGRQSQTWVRLPAGWRIVAAHVSEPAVQPAQP
ncbi:AtzH-like domain-containing protein [Phytohabitans kaempferiae]|uniref:AtzH-like domain-containing protein n=1 Tax=Phytohabitans kaempferiae TaxID=1620943 RepID=A0ABV6M035_9ACTN